MTSAADSPIQNSWLNDLRKKKVMTIIFLVNGYQIRGTIESFDNFSVVVITKGTKQLLYKHAISTMVEVEDRSRTTVQ
ncbi:MAG: RNA chaperone Hfq [Acidibacillus sp.]|uniref:RNA-binding protein Hfq n=1 Tax=Sulfoacidibacillus ferrooxidans TaxID=2005001 RepID=A0A9X1VB91_9BACL|nr:RNA chaperone Hfq [Sulfoacidibacillus ferrooxidans]MCI0184863.1 RNA-binding protein Hfq [Sulfoacidibacillus ferrooxidans]MCY0892144.1 RNA chaperone Hfq [Acidibacillus sp.]